MPFRVCRLVNGTVTHAEHESGAMVSSKVKFTVALTMLLWVAGCKQSGGQGEQSANGYGAGAATTLADRSVEPDAGTAKPVDENPPRIQDDRAEPVAEWRVSSTPAISIGAESSGPTSDLFRARPLLLSDGTLVVGDAKPRLMFFDSSWNHVKTVGRHGGGPGEFVAMARVQRMRGDSIVVLDTTGGDGRTSVFTREGDFVRYVNTGGIPRPIFNAMLEDGTFLALDMSPYPAASVGEVSRTMLDLLYYDREGKRIRSLGEIPGTEVLVTPGMLVAEYGLLSTRVKVHGRSVYAITGDTYEIRVYDVDRGHVRNITYPHSPVRYAAADVVEAFSGSYLAAVVTRANLRRWPEDKVYPAVSDVAVDEDGNIWVEEYRPDDGPRQWRVFSSTGDVIATALMPARFMPYQILGDRILGVEKDQFDVERVQIRNLTK